LPAGSLTIGLYDAQGREVGRWRRAVESSGLASFDLLLDARGHLGPGIYFVRLAHDVRGRISTTKVAVIE
jgi:hypothetical protein